MSDLNKETLLEIVDSTLAWGSTLSDLWTGTQYETQIDVQQAQVIKAVENEDYKKVETLVADLAQFLFHAEEEYERV